MKPLARLCRIVEFESLIACWLLGACLLPAPASAVNWPKSTWPQPYSVQRDKAAGTLTLSTPYYRVEHDLNRGGAIVRIALTNGKATNLLVAPIAATVRTPEGVELTDLADASPKITHRRSGLTEIVTVDAALLEPRRRSSGLRVRTRIEYHWGYLKIHREFLGPDSGYRVLTLSPLTTVLAPGLCDYGYREGLSEAEGAPQFSFGSNRWGKLRPGHPSDPPLRIPYVPRSMIFVDRGVEGLEWFVTSDLAQWEMPLGRSRGQGECRLELDPKAPGLRWSLTPLRSTNEAINLPRRCAFDFYLAVPLRESAASGPWLHTSFNRNRGNWVSAAEIRRWSEQGYQSVHCHNDGDYYDDGLFWRDGSYPPYPDMDRYDQVLQECGRAGIRTATYFSNKELHPSTEAYQQNSLQWGRMDRQGKLQHNFYRGQSEFGAQMCLRSGWLKFLQASIDRVLRNHPLDGVYYDWNVALFCSNPRHESPQDSPAAVGHWDIDELLQLMEWTRQRVGPNGLVIVHNTTTPMFAMENFADTIVATEWGYGQWKQAAPLLDALPVEWSLAGARPRGVISYGTISREAPARLHRVFALQAFLGGVTPWPASPATFDLLPVVNAVGDFSSFRFADWRNPAVTLSEPRCASAVYSRPGEACLLLANLEPVARDLNCVLHPQQLPCPLAGPLTAELVLQNPSGNTDQQRPTLDARQLVGEGIRLTVPLDGFVLVRVRGVEAVKR